MKKPSPELEKLGAVALNEAKRLKATYCDIRITRYRNQTMLVRLNPERGTGKTLVVLERVQADIVFLDPPYQKEIEYESALIALGASGSKLVIAQHASRASLNPEYANLKRYRLIKQGDNSLSFYQS